MKSVLAVIALAAASMTVMGCQEIPRDDQGRSYYSQSGVQMYYTVKRELTSGQRDYFEHCLYEENEEGRIDREDVFECKLVAKRNAKQDAYYDRDDDDRYDDDDFDERYDD